MPSSVTAGEDSSSSMLGSLKGPRISSPFRCCLPEIPVRARRVRVRNRQLATCLILQTVLSHRDTGPTGEAAADPDEERYVQRTPLGFGSLGGETEPLYKSEWWECGQHWREEKHLPTQKNGSIGDIKKET